MREYFKRLLGNVETKTRIGTAIDNGRMPHAFLLTGADGSGKRMLATEIAAALNCEGRGEVGSPLPCGVCNSCRRIYEGNFTDVKILEKPKDRATIGVEPIKLLREDMFLSASESDYKVYVIDNAELMTPEAQNALLKVLEEPPLRVVIILLSTEGDKILTTIKSRVQHVALSRFGEGEMREYLLSKSEEARRLSREAPDKLEAIIMSADGRLGQAEALMNKKLSDACESGRETVLEILRALRRGGSYATLYSAMSDLPQKRAELVGALELIITAIRDMILAKHSEGRLLFFTSREECQSLGEEIGVRRLMDIYDAVAEAHSYCQKNANVSNLISNLTAKIKPVQNTRKDI